VWLGSASVSARFFSEVDRRRGNVSVSSFFNADVNAVG